MSKLDVTDVYHHSTLQPSHVGDFAYVTPLTADGDCIIICINLVLPMGWMGSSKFFCALSGTLTNVANALVHTSLPVLGYITVTKIPETGTGPIQNLDRPTHIDCDMDDVITVV